jgi:hypothetical protein
VRVAASDRRQTIQVVSTNYTCHFSSVSLDFSIGLRGINGRGEDPLLCSKVRSRRGTEGDNAILVVYLGL